MSWIAGDLWHRDDMGSVATSLSVMRVLCEIEGEVGMVLSAEGL